MKKETKELDIEFLEPLMLQRDALMSFDEDQLRLLKLRLGIDENYFKEIFASEQIGFTFVLGLIGFAIRSVDKVNIYLNIFSQLIMFVFVMMIFNLVRKYFEKKIHVATYKAIIEYCLEEKQKQSKNIIKNMRRWSSGRRP